MGTTIDESGRTSRTQSERQEFKKKQQKTLWDDMKNIKPDMKSNTKKKNKIIQEMLGN